MHKENNDGQKPLTGFYVLENSSSSSLAISDKKNRHVNKKLNENKLMPPTQT
jgi:hypothetical protein